MINLKSIKAKLNFKNPVFLGIAVSLAIFIVIIGIYDYFIYSKLKIKAAQKEAALSAVKTKYDSYLVLVKSYPALLAQEKKLNKEFSGLLDELPSKKDIPQLLMKISNYEKILGLNLKMFKPEKGAAEGFYRTVPFSMNITGNFYNVYKFFYKLAVMKRIVDVHNVSISGMSKNNEVSAGFKGTTFSFIKTVPAKPVNTVKKTGGAVKK